LVLRWILGRQGIYARIIFGARKSDEVMQAHAWVEVDGVSLDEDDNTPVAFSPFEKRAAASGN
jgi:transglutaminase superfamily protein